MSEDVVVYQISFANNYNQVGDKRITVPSDCKVVYGTIQGGSKTATMAQAPLVLRFYTNDEQLLAMFHGVLQFRRIDLPCMEMRILVNEKLITTGELNRMNRDEIKTRTEVWVDINGEGEVTTAGA